MTDDFESPDLSFARAHLSDGDYRRRFNRLDFIVLADQQKAVLNAPERRIAVFAGNQSGKTEVGAYKVACEALGRFPEYYTGRRVPRPKLNRAFDKVIWCVSTTNLLVRDAAQARLLGSVMTGGQGQGLIPADRILDISASRGIAGLVDTAVIRADDGSTSAIQFRSYDMSRDALQSQANDFIWLDEMLTDIGLFNEFPARGTATSGGIWLTATPRKQQSHVSLWFRERGHADRAVYKMSARHTTHLTPEMVSSMEASYSQIERRTRIEGDDYSGGGLVMQATRATAGINRRLDSFPRWARKIVGFDPSHGGLSESAHPAGCVFCTFDDSTGIFSVIDAWKQQHLLPEQLAARILSSPWGNAPVAWGAAERQGSGRDADSYAQMYKKLGLKMLGTHATLPGGGYGLDPTFDAIQADMANGKLKINCHLHDLWDEIEGLERDEHGKIICVRDEILAALRYAYLMRKFAKETDDPRGGAFSQLAERQTPRVAAGVDFDVFEV